MLDLIKENGFLVEALLFGLAFYFSTSVFAPKAITYYIRWKKDRKPLHFSLSMFFAICAFFLISSLFILFIQPFVSLNLSRLP
jgi:hypothetical protein